MRKMYAYLLTTTIVFTLILLTTLSTISATGYTDPDTRYLSPTPTIPNPSVYGSLEELISGAAQFIRPLFLITFGAMILVSAGTIMTAQSDATKVQSGRQILIAAIIGFALAVFAPAIVNFVTGFLGVTGFDFTP